MNTIKHLGKISKVRIGSGGYQDAMFGVSFELSFDCCCVVGDFWGFWGPDLERSANAKWTEDDRRQAIQGAFWRLAETMKKAKVSDFTKLAGVPIEVEVEGGLGGTLKSWRILEEVL